MEWWQARLGACSAPPAAPPAAHEPRLTAEEWTKAARIGAITKADRLAALSNADLDLAECLRGSWRARRAAWAVAWACGSPQSPQGRQTRRARRRWRSRGS